MFEAAAETKRDTDAAIGMLTGFRQTVAGALTSLANAIDGTRAAPPSGDRPSAQPERRPEGRPEGRPESGAHPVQLQSPTLARWSRERNDADAFNRRLQQAFVEAALPASSSVPADAKKPADARKPADAQVPARRAQAADQRHR